MLSHDLASAPWTFRDLTTGGPPHPAVVPGCVHRDLRRAGLIPDPFWGTNELGLQWIEERDWEYAATFDVAPEMLAREVVELCADGLDTVAAVELNGVVVGRTENMFVAHRWEVKGLLHAGPNHLRIVFASALGYIRAHRPDHAPREFNDPVGRCQVIRKQQCQFGWDWGPRFVTAGIWRGLRLEAWDGDRLAGVRLGQRHADGRIWLTVSPEWARGGAGGVVDVSVALAGGVVAEARAVAGATELEIPDPQLWWPNGHGAQPLYDVRLTARAGDRPAGRLDRRVGLRTVALDRSPDEWGEAFRFVVNGRPLFAKGANWIPAHSFVAGLPRADYARDLRAAALAHMNMVRVWGGGIYESEDFYDLCDELGLLVWQDFMFACSIYPGDAAFLASVEVEARQQVARLRHRACLALWCGNNEIAGLNVELLARPGLRADFEALFHGVLANAVAGADGVTAYWPSSPWRGGFEAVMGGEHVLGEARGDTHFWDVWHARKPVKDYEKYRFRFCSEFGMQSYSSPETNVTFCDPAEGNVFGPAMENHQKNQAGNQIILDYVSRRYRFPKSQDDLIYLSQLNQAHCMQVGVEHWRRHQPRCMGALYWQLNDCWPVASWSSIEFTGRWRALHFAAKRFFAPALVSAHVPGDEFTTIGNYRRTTVDANDLFTVSDRPGETDATLVWELRALAGGVLERAELPVTLRYGESVPQARLRAAPWIAAHGRENIYLRVALRIGTELASEETVFFCPPRFCALPRGDTGADVLLESPRRALLTFHSEVFQHRLAFELPGLAHTAADNFFELYPGLPKAVAVELERDTTVAELSALLRWRSLVDTY